MTNHGTSEALDCEAAENSRAKENKGSDLFSTAVEKKRSEKGKQAGVRVIVPGLLQKRFHFLFHYHVDCKEASKTQCGYQS